MTNKNKWLIGIGGLIAAATAIFLVKKNKSNNTNKPPKKAPQLDIENPGSQDDFPNPPMESEIG
jgi:LPXTG-motif cell wall-anchored protein